MHVVCMNIKMSHACAFSFEGVSKDADVATIRKAYRKIAQANHPDKSNGQGSVEIFNAATTAYEVLTDPGMFELARVVQGVCCCCVFFFCSLRSRQQHSLVFKNVVVDQRQIYDDFGEQFR